MATLIQRIEELERLVKEIIYALGEISKEINQKQNKPYSKVSPSDKLSNLDGIWIKGTFSISSLI